jgi:hypothetical protein
MTKLANLGRGAHLAISRGPGGEWRATLRLNVDDDGEGVSVMGCAGAPSSAVARAIVYAHQALTNPVIAQLLPPETPAALDVTNRLAELAHTGELSRVVVGPQGEKPLWRHFENPVLREIAKRLAQASDASPVTLTAGPEVGWRGGGGRGAFGNRRAWARRYARPNRRPAGHGPRGTPHPYAPHPGGAPWGHYAHAPGIAPVYPVAPYPYPAPDYDGGAPDGGGAPDDSSQAPAAQDTPTPAAPSRGKHRHHHDHGAPDPWDVQALVQHDIDQAMAPPPAGAPDVVAPAPDPAATMGWNPFHAISHAVHHAIHFVAHPPTWFQVIMPVLSPTAQKFAAEHVLGKQGDALFSAYQGAMDAAASGHLGAKELLAKVPQIAQVAQAAASGGAPAVAQLASQAAAAGGAPDINALASSAASAAQSAVSQATNAVAQAQGGLDALAQDAAGALMGAGGWSPSPYYGSYHPSRGLPTERPIRFWESYNRIYPPEPVPRYFRFMKAF